MVGHVILKLFLLHRSLTLNREPGTLNLDSNLEPLNREPPASAFSGAPALTDASLKLFYAGAVK